MKIQPGRMITFLTLTLLAAGWIDETVQAANITWETPSVINADANVRTDGSLVGAFTVGANAVGTTVNGVSFTPVTVSGTWNDTATPSLSFGAVATLAGNHSLYGTTWPGENSAPANPTLSSAYQKVVQTGVIPVTADSTTFTLTLTNLTVGNTYLFQTWVDEGRASTRTETVTGGGTTSGVLTFNNIQADGGNGSYVVGTFTADATTQTVTYTAVLGGVAEFNAFQLRNTTGGTVQEANIKWETPGVINADTNVRTDGVLVGAFTVGANAVATTVNGVSFTPVTVSGTWNDTATPSVSFGTVATLTGNHSLYGSAWSGENSTPATPPLTAAYQQLVQTYVIPCTSDSSTFTLTLTNLAVGSSYLFQTWVDDGRFADNARTETVTGGANASGVLNFSTGTPGGNGSYVVGIFKATATTQTITYDGLAGGVAQFNAFQLRWVPPQGTMISIR